MLLSALAQVGARFDVASPAEVRAALAAGASADELVYSNPVKRADHIRDAAYLGVRLFAVDSLPEVSKIAGHAPGAAVLARIRTSGAGSDYPLSRKFGASTAETVAMLRTADALGLVAAGVSFHVGSQQHDPLAWGPPIATAAQIFDELADLGIRPDILDLGGGFPAGHEGPTPTPPLRAYADAIEDHLEAAFGGHRPHTIIEPGRGIVGDAGTVVASVIGVVQRDGRRWVHLDAGVFSGLVETLDEAIRYRIDSSADAGPVGPCVLAGPTCDSADVLYEKVPVDLPLSLTEGDTVRFHAAGAYTSCYSTVGFNGFDPLETVIAR